MLGFHQITLAGTKKLECLKVWGCSPSAVLSRNTVSHFIVELLLNSIETLELFDQIQKKLKARELLKAPDEMRYEVYAWFSSPDQTFPKIEI